MKAIFDRHDDGSPDAFGKAVEELQQVDPPEAIADDYRTVMDAYGDEDADAAKVDAAGKRLQPWLERNCEFDLTP